MMHNTNIVFIGRPSFPIGNAMCKRHKYYIDFLTTIPNISICHINTWNTNNINPTSGLYKDSVKFYNTNLPKSLLSITSIANTTNKILENRFCKDCRNIVIFCSFFTLEQIPIVLKAKQLGYKIICDVVENYDASGSNMSKQMKIAYLISKYFLYKNVDGFIAISNGIYNQYTKYKKPILILTNSAPIKHISQKAQFSSPMRIIYTGTYAPKDGLIYLLEGFNKLTKREGNIAELILIGRENGITTQMKHIISQNKHIKQLGYVSDEILADLQLSADLLCMTRCNSNFANYGFPFKLSEYMATGNTILATAVGDVPIYIKNRINGLLIPPNNSEAIYEAIKYAYNNQKECIQMGKNGLNTIKESFDVEKNGLSLLNFINSI